MGESTERSINDMVILHVIPDLFEYGGTPRKLLSLVHAMDSSCFRHVFLVFGTCEDDLANEMREAGAIVIQVSRPKNYDVRLLWDICRVVHSCDVDIICTHFARADVYGTLAGILMRKPVVKNVHGVIWNESPWIQKLDGFLSSFRACTVCNSKATLEAVQRQGGARNGVVIYNGVLDRAVTRSREQVGALRASLGIPPDAFVIGHVGGLDPKRNQGVMIDALALLLQKVKNSYLVMVGGGPLWQKLEQHAIDLGVRERVLFLGYRGDVPELMTTFNVYVNMTHAEGFGIAVVEAMQAGLPVILANAGSLPELVEKDVSGILVPPCDSTALASSLVRLALNEDLREQIGMNARERAANNFAVERYARNMGMLYEEVCARQ